MTSLPRLLSLNLRGNRFSDLRYASIAQYSTFSSACSGRHGRGRCWIRVDRLLFAVADASRCVRKPTRGRRRAVASRPGPPRSAGRRRQPVRLRALPPDAVRALAQPLRRRPARPPRPPPVRRAARPVGLRRRSCRRLPVRGCATPAPRPRAVGPRRSAPGRPPDGTARDRGGRAGGRAGRSGSDCRRTSDRSIVFARGLQRAPHEH